LLEGEQVSAQEKLGLLEIVWKLFGGF